MTMRDKARRLGLATGLTLLIPITLSTMAVVLLAPVVPKLMGEFGAAPNADFLVPAVLTTPALCIALLSPVAGAFGDYLGRRRLLIASLALYGAVGLLPIFLTDLGQILASRIGVGVAEAFIMTMTTTLIGDYFSDRERDRWLAAQTAVASLSAFPFFIVGGLLGASGWRTPFWVYASAFLMLAAVLAFTWEPGAQEARTAEARAPRNTSWKGFPWGPILRVSALTVFGAVLFYIVPIQAAGGLVAHGLTDPKRIGFLTALSSLGVPLGALLYGRMRRTPVPIQLFASLGLLGAGTLIMGLAPSVVAFLAGCAASQLGAGLLAPSVLVWAMGQLSFDVRARGIGIWQSSFALGQFLSPIATALLVRRTGSLSPALQAFGWAGLLAAVVILVAGLAWRRPERSAAA